MTMDLKISEMVAATRLLGDELLPIVQGTQNRKTTAQDLRGGGLQSWRNTDQSVYVRWYFAGMPSATVAQVPYDCGALDLIALPDVFGNGGRITKVGVVVTTPGGAGCKGRIAIYSVVSNERLDPGALLWESTDLNLESAGLVWAPLDFQQLPGVPYYFVLWTSDAVSVAGIQMEHLPPFLGVNPYLDDAQVGASGSAAAMPMPNPFDDPPGPLGVGTANVPRIGILYSPDPVVVVDDICHDANGTALDAHSIAPVNLPPTSWTVLSGTLEIQSNVVDVTATGYNDAVVDPGFADCEISEIGRAHV